VSVFSVGASPTPPAGDAGAPPPTHGPGRTGLRVSWWVVVGVLLVVWALVSQVVTLRNRTNALTTQVAALESRIAVPVPVLPTTPPAAPVPPVDAEAARRSVVEAVGVVFAAAPTLEQRLPFVNGSTAAAPEFAPLVEAASRGPCAGATPVVTDVRFTSDDTARAEFRVDGTTVPAAQGYRFSADLVRGVERWQVTAASVVTFAQLAQSFC